jgi:hypothetical protein
MHQSENKPPSAGGSDWSPARDGDNSIQTNDYNPNLGGNCFATPGLTPVTPTITVEKTNNAAGTGYGKSEQAPNAGATVPFRVTVTNTSPFPLVVQSISDAYSGQTVSPTCTQAFIGQTLATAGQPGDDATCDFTLTNYAPPAGQSLIDTATVVAQVPGSSNSSTGVSASSTSATGSSTSTVTTPSQSAAGSILLCNGQMPTTTTIGGGVIKLRSPTGAQLANASDQLGATSVDQPGTYTLDATAPTGYDFVACGQSAVSIASPATSASQPVVVPSGGSGTGVFYVSPIAKPAQTLTGSILACPDGTPTTTPVNGGSLLVNDASGSAVLRAVDQLSTSGVSAGTYKVAATAPDSYQFVSCGQDGVTIGQAATNASQPVAVPSGGTGSAVFYVAPIPAIPKVTSQTVAGTILACGQDGQPTTDPVMGGSLALLSGDQTVVTSPDQLAATAVRAGTYTLAANAPSGYDLVACGQTGVAIANPATGASQPVAVPAGGSGHGTFYVAPIPAQVLGETLTQAPPAGNAPVVTPSSLAFTGPPPALRLLLLLGLSFLSAGCFLLWVTRSRQTATTGA